jgi:hypothetical protein
VVPGLTVISPGCAVPGGFPEPDELLELLELDEEDEPVEYTLLAQAPPQVSLLLPVQAMLQLFDVPCDP